MFNVTVILFDDGYASTALMPIEIFHSAGALWRELQGECPEPRFKVTTASLDGKAVKSPYAGLQLTPEGGIDDIARTDIVIVPTSGLALDEKLLENSKLLPWLQHHYARGAYIAGVCMGAAYLAEAGLLDGRRRRAVAVVHRLHDGIEAREQSDCRDGIRQPEEPRSELATHQPAAPSASFIHGGVPVRMLELPRVQPVWRHRQWMS